MPRFNPHPASLPGDATDTSRHFESPAGFNPHPASLPGDAGAGRMRIEFRRVSIRTRHLCRVMHRNFEITGSVSRFQSAPGISAG